MKKTPFIDAMAIFGFLCVCALGVWALTEEMQQSRPAAALPAERGTASWYSTRESRNLMANGRPLNDNHYTCASWTYPLGSVVRVTSGGRSVECVVTDRGPAKRLVAQGRVIDLTRAAFSRLGDLRRGLIDVTVERVR